MFTTYIGHIEEGLIRAHNSSVHVFLPLLITVHKDTLNASIKPMKLIKPLINIPFANQELKASGSCKTQSAFDLLKQNIGSARLT